MIEKTIKVNSIITGSTTTLIIGRQMENNYREIVFDCSGFDGEITSITLVHQRSEDIAPYVVQTTESDSLTWTVTDTDTAFAGMGKAELRISFADGLAKSVVFTSIVIESITGDVTVPEPLQSWYDAMIAYIDEHTDVAQAIEEYMVEHPISAPVTSVNSRTGDIVLTASDVGALPSSTVIPAKTSDLVNDSGYITTAPVASVNNKTGAVVLTASDVGAMADTYTAPVTSVNGMTGAVTVPDNNTTYTIIISGNVISLTPSSGSAQTITLPVWSGGVS